jgi:hypothetical protein
LEHPFFSQILFIVIELCISCAPKITLKRYEFKRDPPFQEFRKWGNVGRNKERGRSRNGGVMGVRGVKGRATAGWLGPNIIPGREGAR